MPVQETTQVYGSYHTTVYDTAYRQVTTQVPYSVTVMQTHTTTIWVAPVTTDIPVTVTHPGYSTATWIPPVTTTSPVYHPGYSTTVWHPGYSTSVWHPGYSTSVWHPGYSTSVWHAGYYARGWISGHTTRTWHNGYWTKRPIMRSGR